MTNLPPIPSLPYDTTGYFSARDAEHLNLLGVFHYVWGGLVMLLSSIFIVHIVLGILMLNGAFNNTGTGPPPPAGTGWLLIGIGSGAVLVGWTIGFLVIYSGRCLRARRRWTFSLVIAGFICLSVPLGTVLGVFTFLVLLRDSVKAMYAQTAARYPAV